MGIGVPSLVKWIVGLPFIGFLYLYRNRRRLENPVIFGRFRLIYQGLKTDMFYWEFINMIRKTVLVLVNVFLN